MLHIQYDKEAASVRLTLDGRLLLRKLQEEQA